MRAILVGVVLTVAALVPTNGNAQAYNRPSPPPQVTAAGADWQIQGAPVFYAGNFYYPTGPSIFFDGNVMVRTAVYKGVPIYVDASVDPYGVVYVPIGGNVVRPYERRRAGELAGTVGNRPPSFPIERDVELSVASSGTGLMTPPTGVTIDPDVTPEGERAIGTRGTIVPRTARGDGTITPALARPAHTIVESIPQPRTNSGIWLEFNGARYYSNGAAVPYAPDRFTPIGEHHGFPVYRNVRGSSNEIFVAVVKGGPLAPFRR